MYVKRRLGIATVKDILFFEVKLIANVFKLVPRNPENITNRGVHGEDFFTLLSSDDLRYERNSCLQKEQLSVALAYGQLL